MVVVSGPGFIDAVLVMIVIICTDNVVEYMMMVIIKAVQLVYRNDWLAVYDVDMICYK